MVGFAVSEACRARRGISGLLALTPDIEVIVEAADGAQAVEIIPQVAPDVVPLDVRMPELSSIEVLTTLR